MEQQFIYYKNSLGRRFCTLRYFKSRHLLSIVWKGTAPEERIQEVEAGIKKMLTNFDCRSVLNDVQEFYSASSEILADLVKYEWDKKLATISDVQFIAHVLPPQIPLPPPQVENQAVEEVRFFHHQMDALQWIHSKRQV